jgi:mRNA-degrading endonuclease RelE of RelBE toxin-antitoxin system
MAESFVQVGASQTFDRNLRTLAKKYRGIRSDIQPIVEQLERGETPGEQVPGIGYAVFKVRVKNSDVQKGKSGGYRLLYYIRTPSLVILLTLYPKSEQADIAAADLKTIITEYERGEG